MASALWSGQAHMPTALEKQVVITGGEGAYITTSQGERLLDATAGLWHANIGHGRPEIADAAAAQLRKLETYHVFGRFANDAALAVSDRIAALSPIPDPRVILTSGGSDSIDASCKLALRHWYEEGRPGKQTILSREKSYHGLHAYGTSIAGIEPNREGMGTASLVPDTARVATNDLAALEREILRLGAETIAAIVAEPIVGTGGVIPPAPGYLEGLQRLARQHDILFILDEVITGFGRTGQMFAAQTYGLDPDMIVFAKGVTSGYAALGGVMVSERIWGRFWRPDGPILRQGLTYSGHATACAIALENLRILEEEHLVERADELSGELERAVRPLADHPLVAEVRTGGLLAGVQLAPGMDGERIVDAALKRGVVLRSLIGPTLQISPPFVITPAEIARIADVIRESLDAYSE